CEQHDLSAVRDLFAHCFLIFSDVLSALDTEQEAGEQGGRPILCLTLTGPRLAKWWCACKASTRNLARPRSCAAWTWKLAGARWWPSSGVAVRARAPRCAALICWKPLTAAPLPSAAIGSTIRMSTASHCGWTSALCFRAITCFRI